MALADRYFEVGNQGSISCIRDIFFHKLWVQEVEIKKSVLIRMYGCCRSLVLLDSSGASVNDEAGIGSYYIVEEGY